MLEWANYVSNQHEAKANGHIYFCFYLSVGLWEVDRYSTTGHWLFAKDSPKFATLEEAKQWCEVHYATGA